MLSTIGLLLLFALPGLLTAQEIPPELRSPNYRITELDVIGYSPEFDRQDPSNVIKVDDMYYIWYTQRKAGIHPYASTIYYAASKDGFNWTEKGQALKKGEPGAWDSFGVITPYMAIIGNNYYLFYTATSDVKPFHGDSTLRHIGIAISDNPDGPWKKFAGNPVFSPSPDRNQWDGLVVDDTHIIVRDGKFWFYYKGRSTTIPPTGTMWGLALSDNITGPYTRYSIDPIFKSGHTVCIWPHRKGVAALVDAVGTEKHTVQYARDGINFKRAAKVERVHIGCGPYCEDAFTNTNNGRGISWGVAQESRNKRLFIIRFDVNLLVPDNE